MSTHILGIRHHGPGSAKHLLNSLNELKPDIVLIEGPPEGETMIPCVEHSDMKPPVALLAYVPDLPSQAVFYPFAEFSPEWNAMKYGLKHKIPVRFIDMPLTHQLARHEKSEAEISADHEEETVLKAERNPISYLAEIAGYEDAEVWWDHHFELGQQGTEVFTAIAEAMKSLRQYHPETNDPREKIREAFMRKAIRLAQREMYSTIVVICGAWHVPALEQMPSQKDDDALLKNLPKVKIETTWIPWTNDRLSFESGYGAGVHSPGWYSHRWNQQDEDGIKWLTHTARVFRKNKIDISSAHVIEAVRLANSLAAIRNLSRPGLGEFKEATQTVMCMGEEVLLQIIHRELIVGQAMGEIPEGTPRVPLLADFEKQAKTLRLKLSAEQKLISIDLREENDLKKSVMLHRLNVMNITWGEFMSSKGKGTFKEEWIICWTPEMHIALIEKAPWGNTLLMAANQFILATAKDCQQLSEISSLLQKAIPAELHEGIQALLLAMDSLAASSNDTLELMDTLIPLGQISRYGNVRKTDLIIIENILQTLFYRMLAGLPLSATGIDEDQSVTLTAKINEVHKMILLLEHPEMKQAWLEAVLKLCQHEQADAMVQGYGHKILFDTQFIPLALTINEFNKALSINQTPTYAVQWLEGFLKDAASLLILDDAIWNIVYDWVASLEERIFIELTPLLRRTFAGYNIVERQKIAEKVKHGKSQAKQEIIDQQLNHERARKVIPTIEKLLHLK